MRARSQLEIKFLLIWKKIDGQKLEEEFRFHHVRKWRFDFAHTDSKVAIEIEGGIWGKVATPRPWGISRIVRSTMPQYLTGGMLFAFRTTGSTPKH